MTEEQDVKVALKKTLEELLAKGTDLHERVQHNLKEVDKTDTEWGQLFQRLHAASSRVPARPFNRYYQRELNPATEPIVTGLMDEINDEHYGEITTEYITELTEKYETPAVKATEEVFDDVTAFFREASARVLTLRFFSNSEVLLKKFENALAPPWAQPIKVTGSMNQFNLPWWAGTPTIEHPPHLVLHAVRTANKTTLEILAHKLGEIVATLKTAIDELPFAERLKQPQAVPQTLIDYSTHIGQGAQVRDAAIGQGSQRQR